MSFLRRNIIGPLVLQSFGISLLGFVLGAALYLYNSNPWASLGLGLGVLFVGNLILLILQVHIPLHIVTEEMKALLTGKSYRKIMTTKRNEIGILAHFFNEITRNLEHISTDVREHQRIKKELNTAQKIQRDLLPETAPEIPYLEITAKTRPASEIGGDAFDFFLFKDYSLMYIGDSTGHGVPAGIVMVMVDTLITTFIGMSTKITEIMINLNKYLKPHLQTTMFMTMILLRWDHKNTLSWVGGGHEYLVHAKTKAGEVMSSPSGGIAVGMLADNTALVKEQSFTLEEDDFVILYSDGIVEAKNVMGEIYTLERLEQTIRNTIHPALTSEQLFNKIASDVSRFMEGHVQEDDMTLIVIKKTAQKGKIEDPSTEWTSEESAAE